MAARRKRRKSLTRNQKYVLIKNMSKLHKTNTHGSYRGTIRPVEQVSMSNPYKYEKKDSDWEKICKKYGEEDKSKLKKEKNND